VLPHVPQFSTAVFVLVSHPLLSFVSQLPQPPLQEAMRQLLLTHSPVAFVNVHALLQKPQCAALFVVFVSHPGTPGSQSPRPGLQLETSHTPPTHTAVPPPAGHSLPHVLQFVGSASRLASQPLSGLPSQSAKPVLHPTSTQVPPTQEADALAKEQLWPHDPQLARFVAESSSQPFSVTESQLPQPELQLLIEHTPARQLVVALGNVHVQPHWLSTPPPPQVSGAVQSPQLTSPHPVLIAPHDAPSWEQDLGVQPHWLITPPPPHTSGVAHSPQSSASLHPSEMNPHAAPSCAQLLGMHSDVPQRFVPPPPQTWPPLHVPQFNVPRHPSGKVPQFTPICEHVLGVQPQTFNSPLPPQTSGGAQPPQSMAIEHPSDAHPHCAPVCTQLFGKQSSVPHTFVPPPPQSWPSGHSPHSIFPPHPSGAEPQLAPIWAHVFGSHTVGPVSGSAVSFPTSVTTSVDVSEPPASFFGPGDADPPSSPPHAIRARLVKTASRMMLAGHAGAAKLHRPVSRRCRLSL
jgi:hypothetical protein